MSDAGTASGNGASPDGAGAIRGAADLYVGASSRHGRGVYAARRFEAGEELECCPVIVLGAAELPALDDTALYGYVYEWDDDVAFALGFGSLYNHSPTPNAEYELLDDEQAVRIRATRTIEPGDEVTICYADDAELWFDPAD